MLAELDRQPGARAVLAPALAPDGAPSHAYLFHGPGGAGKRAVARAMAAELLCAGAPDPAGARARVLSGAHPDLTWIVPSGAHEILVSDIDEPVVAAASRTPFEAGCRVFVIERVDELGDEAANRMLKTLEEPPRYVHMILLTDRLTEVLPTISSRCQLVRFDPPGLEQVAAEVQQPGVTDEQAMACARLSLGDLVRARLMASPLGSELRAAAERMAGAVLEGESARAKPWAGMLAAVRRQGEQLVAELEREAEREIELYPSKERKRVQGEWAERIKRARRREETRGLDLGLQLVALWFADLAALAWGVPELARNCDRLAELRAGAAGARGAGDPRRLIAAVELVEETRRRFVLNVSEELACEALCYRLERVLGR